MYSLDKMNSFFSEHFVYLKLLIAVQFDLKLYKLTKNKHNVFFVLFEKWCCFLFRVLFKVLLFS